MATDGNTSATLTRELIQLRQENQLLRAERQQSVQEVELLRAQRQQLLEDRQRDTRTIEQLQHQLQELLRRMYGRSSEKIDRNQLVLFEQIMEELQARQTDPGAPGQTPPADAPPSASDSTKPKNNGRVHGRGRIPADLEREKVIHDLPEDQKLCPCCGKMRHVIGEEVSEKLDYVAPKVKVIEEVRLTYACRHCEQSAAEG